MPVNPNASMSRAKELVRQKKLQQKANLAHPITKVPSTVKQGALADARRKIALAKKVQAGAVAKLKAKLGK